MSTNYEYTDFCSWNFSTNLFQIFFFPSFLFNLQKKLVPCRKIISSIVTCSIKWENVTDISFWENSSNSKISRKNGWIVKRVTSDSIKRQAFSNKNSRYITNWLSEWIRVYFLGNVRTVRDAAYLKQRRREIVKYQMRTMIFERKKFPNFIPR